MDSIQSEIERFIFRTISLGQTPLILIDGPAGSGKSTLAAQISMKFNCDLLHMDDFYFGWDEPLDAHLYERVFSALNHLENPADTNSFKVFDWSQRIFKPRTQTRIGNTFVVEGVGSFGLQTSAKYEQLKIWTHADPQKCFDRVLERDGEDYRQLIIDWQVHEAKYFKQTAAPAQADFTWFT